MVTKPDKEQQLKWQAEDIVRTAIANTPAFRKAVRQTMKELRQTHKNAVKRIKGKK